MSFNSFNDEESEKSREFIRKYLNIEDIESILFVLNKPSWKGKDDVRFWGATGVVQEFLSKVWDYSIAPIRHTENTRVDFRRSTDKEKLFLYITNKEKLQALANDYRNNTEFFKALESTYISDLIADVRVKVKKRNIDGEVTFRELSEGEQQLLTVLGLLKFTKDEETLVLLDEPDTHLNPRWKWEYLQMLRDVIGNDETTHVILNTHDPLVIGGMVKEQVRIFKSLDEGGKTIAEAPDIDPKGLGVSGILASELFDLPSLLDFDTQKELNYKRYLEAKSVQDKLTSEETSELQRLTEKLNQLGFYDVTSDKTYDRYLKHIYQNELFQKVEFTKEEEEEINEISKKVLGDILKEKS